MINKIKQMAACYKINKLFMKLVRIIDDINPSVKEINRVCQKCDEFGYTKFVFTIDLKVGKRFIVLSDEKLARRFSICEEKPIEYSNYIEYSPIFTISYAKEEHWIDIMPNLGEAAQITEEEIYLYLLEIKNIIAKYKYPTANLEHEELMSKFLDRFNK